VIESGEGSASVIKSIIMLAVCPEFGTEAARAFKVAL